MLPEKMPQRPLGYWLKKCDEVITTASNAALQTVGLTRFHWQVFHTVHQEGPITETAVFQTVQLFVNATQFTAILNDLRQKEWLSQTKTAELFLTEAGKEAHEHVLTLQNGIRQQTTAGISAEEYATVVRVLQQIVQNLT